MGEEVDVFADARYTAEISQRMRVPDRIVVANATSPARSQSGSARGAAVSKDDPRLSMTVPDRILVGGGNTHYGAKSTPRELQLEASILPPTPEHVRVSTPPRSIRLDDPTINFPAVTDDEESIATTTTSATMDLATLGDSKRRTSRRSSTDTSEAPFLRDSNHSLAVWSDHRDVELSMAEEIQLIRRQMAKLNHRLMSLELENQQQQQRDKILTVLISAYLLGKLIMWVNRSL